LSELHGKLSGRWITIQSTMGKQTGANNAVRLRIIERAFFECENCGTNNFDFGISIHHRKPRGMGGTKKTEINDPSNLLLLCGSGTTGCHGWIESHRTESYEKGLLVKQNDNPEEIPVVDKYENVWKFNNDFTKERHAFPKP
jgi:hypothetical protein